MMNILRTAAYVFSATLLPSLVWAQEAVVAPVTDSMPAAPLMPETAHATAPEAAHHGGLPQFDPTSWPSQIFWLVLFFAILYVFFSRKALPAIGQTVQNRKDHIQKNLDEAAKLSAESARIKSLYEQSLKEASSRAALAVKDAGDAGKAKLAAGLADFRTRAEAEIAAAESRIEQSKDNVLSDINRIAAEIASEAAEKIAGIRADTSQAETVVRTIRANKAKAA
mgnify:CR=1 FL=1|jgi:F-type H+-transporting ATPase subunit b